MPKLKKSGAVTPMFSEKDIYSMAREYSELSAQIKELEARKKVLSDKIKEGSEKFGVKDDKGSYYLENDQFLMGKVAKKSFKIDQDKAVGVLKSMGLGDVVDTVTIETVNEEKLNSAVQEGRISINEVEKFTNVTTSYSVTVKEKEPMPEVEQSTVKMAARKK